MFIMDSLIPTVPWSPSWGFLMATSIIFSSSNIPICWKHLVYCEYILNLILKNIRSSSCFFFIIKIPYWLDKLEVSVCLHIFFNSQI